MRGYTPVVFLCERRLVAVPNFDAISLDAGFGAIWG